MATSPWYAQPLLVRAPVGGTVSPLNGHFYRGGELLPFYIPRERMPQIDADDLPDFLVFAGDRGVLTAHDTVCPRLLRAHQRVDPHKVRTVDLTKPALVSQDRFVLDGNHRWHAHLERGSLMPIIRLGLEFEPAIELMFSFPRAYAYGDGAFHPVKD